MHFLFRPVVLVVVGLVARAASAENKMPAFQARAQAPRLTPEYAKLTNNTEIIFEWHEPRMQQHLWRAATRSVSEGPTKVGKKLGKRVNPPTPRPVGAPLGRGDCAGCADLAANNDADILSYDWQYMQTQMYPARRNQLHNKCVFYTGLPPSEKIEIQAALGLAEPPEGQSDLATQWACKKGFLSIWNLWPGKNDIDGLSQTDKAKPNFWEITEPTSWLYKLDKSNTGQYDGKDWEVYRKHYFRVMSDAVAHSCSGVVYVMAGNSDMKGYIGIWPDTEYPTLKTKNAQPVNSNGRVTRLILVKTLKPDDEQYEMIFDPDLDYPRAGNRITRRDPDYLDFSDVLVDGPANMTTEALRRRELERRNSCTENIAYEKADRGDWFGRGY